MFKWECYNCGGLAGISEEKMQELLVVKLKMLKLCDGLKINEIMILFSQFRLGDFLSTSILDSGEVEKHMEKFYRVVDGSGSDVEDYQECLVLRNSILMLFILILLVEIYHKIFFLY